MKAQSRPRADDPDRGDVLSCLNLGCGEDYREGWVNVDVSDEVDPDYEFDVAEGDWPFDDNSFQHVLARHVLEHLQNPVAALEEIARVLEPDGTLELVYPLGHCVNSDPQHEQFWTYETAEFFDASGRNPWESPVPFSLITRDLDVWLDAPLPFSKLLLRYRLWKHEPGPWLNQVTGLGGEVKATYRKIKHERD